MKRFLSLCVVAILGVASLAVAQPAGDVHVKVPIIPAKPEDVSSIEAIVKVSYDAISGGVGVPRQWARERTIYDVHQRFVSASPDPKTGVPKIDGSNDQEYADQSDAFMVKEGFTERELGHEIHRFGNVATVLSSYETVLASTGKVMDRGVNIFSLYFDGKRWWILSIIWDTERKDNPIPPALLPKG